MATQNGTVTEVPVDLVTDLNLMAGTLYRLTNVGGQKMDIAELAASPDVDDFHGHPVFQNQDEFFTVGANAIYAWTRGRDTTIVVTEG